MTWFLRTLLAAIIGATAIIVLGFAFMLDQAYSSEVEAADPVVLIESADKSFYGSAFHIGDGIFVTAAHVVIRNIYMLRLSYRNGDKGRRATVVALDTRADVAIVSTSDKAPIDSLELDCSPSLEIGDELRAIGSPEGWLDLSTWGRVSRLPGDYGDPFDGAIAINLTVAPGMSGGPVIAADGRVVAIIRSTFISSARTSIPGVMADNMVPLAGAVPASEACRLLGREHIA